MSRPTFEDTFEKYATNKDIFHDLMPVRVREILLVAPAFDAFYADAALHTCKRCGKAQQRATL